jgi:hypothetical protein
MKRERNKNLVESIQDSKTQNEGIEEKSIYSLLKEIELEEDYHCSKILQMIKADPSSVRLIMMERSKEELG